MKNINFKKILTTIGVLGIVTPASSLAVIACQPDEVIRNDRDDNDKFHSDECIDALVKAKLQNLYIADWFLRDQEDRIVEAITDILNDHKLEFNRSDWSIETNLHNGYEQNYAKVAFKSFESWHLKIFGDERIFFFVKNNIQEVNLKPNYHVREAIYDFLAKNNLKVGEYSWKTVVTTGDPNYCAAIYETEHYRNVYQVRMWNIKD